MPDLKDDLDALRIQRTPNSPSRRRWVIWVSAIGILAVIALSVRGVLSRERPIEVQTIPFVTRSAGTQAAVLNASGYVTARRRATVSSKVTGKVVEVNVEEGMAVAKGQVLARLDDSTVRAALALAEAQAQTARSAMRENEVRYEDAKIQLARGERLLKGGAGSQADVDRLHADVESLQARIGVAREQVHVAERQIEVDRANLNDMVIRAPFSGVAISKDAQPGEMVSPISAGGGFTRTGICTIVDMESLEIEVDVNESYINRVKSKQRVTAVLDAYPDWTIPGHVITTVPSADRQKATVLVRIGFEALDPRILPDMGVKVTFLREEDAADAAPAARPIGLVPKTAVRSENDSSYVFVVSNGIAERRAVKTGGSDGDRVEIVSGVSQSERVVVSPPARLTSGARVTSTQ
jgi:RND family efflux transporter MFP subunit